MKNLHKFAASFSGAAVLILVVMVIGLAFRAFRQIGESAEARKKTFVLLNRADDLMSALTDAETGQRGYLLTGDPSLLETYLTGSDIIQGHLKELRRLTLDSAGRQSLDRLVPLVDSKMAGLARGIELHRNRNQTSRAMVADIGRGELRMDSIRSELRRFVEMRQISLIQYDSDFHAKMRHLFILLIFAGLSLLLFAFLLFYLLNRVRQQHLKNQVHLEKEHLLTHELTTKEELQKINLSLQISENKLAVTLDSIGDAVIATDVNGCVILMNPVAQTLTGWTLSEAAGRPIEKVFNIINYDTRLPALVPVTETLSKGTIQGLANHTVLIARDGHEYAIADSCAPIRNPNQTIVGAVLVFRDITVQMETEMGLEKAHQELKVNKKAAEEVSEFAESIINTVREPLISLDQDLRVVTVSRSFYEVFKVYPEETVGHLIYDLGNKQWDIPKLRELLETILPQKTTFDNYEVEHDFATIGRRIMLLNARQIKRASGKERVILLAIEDITERREIEKGLKAAHEELKNLADELKRTAQVKSEFLANMSHELRTPLNSINGFSEVLFDEAFGPLNEKQKKYVNNVLTSGKHLLLLINQILDMAKVEAGKMKLSLSTIPTKSLLNEISLLIADLVRKKNLEIRIEIEENLPNIQADELKVKEIIYNLLSNAIKFSPDGGSIGLQAKKINSDIEIIVWDKGIGIAPENMEKLFEGFFRVDTPYSRITEGTGLGLPLSKSMVELHGGSFSIESEGLDKGTLVRFTLPIIAKNEV